MNKPELLEDIANDERELLFQFQEQSRVSSLSVTIAHRIEDLRTAIAQKRALIRRLENADDVVARRTAGARPALSRKVRT